MRIEISYLPLIGLMVKYGIKNYEVTQATGLSADVLARIKKGKPMMLESLAIIAEYLSKRIGRELKPNDLIQFIYH